MKILMEQAPVDVMLGSLSHMYEGRDLPVVMNTIQFRQSLKSKDKNV